MTAKELPPGTPIPSESLVSLSCLPPSSRKATAKLYSGKLNIRFTIQRRQLHRHHEDNHYVNALKLYAKQFTVEGGSSVIFISYDDKAKVCTYSLLWYKCSMCLYVC